MNVMIRTASVVALVTFWLAAIVWTVLIVAAPANAAPSDGHGAGSTSTSAPAGAGKSSSVKPPAPTRDWAFIEPQDDPADVFVHSTIDIPRPPFERFP